MRSGLQFHQWCIPIAVLVTFLTINALWGCATTATSEPPHVPQPVPGGVRFTVYAPGAKQVSLVGSFNGWVKGVTPMKIQDGAVWSAIVPLKEGEHTFMYLIDGTQWVTPPQADDFVTDEFGQMNGVVVVR